MDIRCKRIYDSPDRNDGRRVLVDRLWPRGIRRADARLDFWLPDIAPSDELRRWFSHQPERFDAFAQRYREELADKATQVERLRALAVGSPLTLLYATRDTQHNNARVLADLLRAAE
ncbi:DUF488 domain-containing protein [Acidihalobacter prosperus]|uniref:MarR family transcriptional regulator n=1 Tax=Acidihalobacter prosperus TaxID=160660 RepID=A0A1A6C2E1_9GAMM|nr:DUF488 domain-containing protein [Acidihalobacter prosperus]OBS08723.1 hypothetical protein Thpro_022973 [Acidihalobacter prosperus]